MSALTVSKESDYERFVIDTQAVMPVYKEHAFRYIKSLTPKRLGEVATRHPDGFLKIQIGPDKGVTEGQVRLHLWVPGVRGSEQPHGHPWHMVSKALVGIYAEYQPDLKPGGELVEHVIHYPPDEDSRAEITKIEGMTYAADRGELLLTQEDEDHALEAGPIHISSASGRGGFTLAVMSPRFDDSANFYAPDPNPNPYVSQISDEDTSRAVDFLHEVQRQL